MKAALVYLGISVTTFVVTSLLLTDPHKDGPGLLPEFPAPPADRVGRDRAIDVANQAVSEDLGENHGKVNYVARRNADGNWIVIIRWFDEDAEQRQAILTIDQNGDVISFEK